MIVAVGTGVRVGVRDGVAVAAPRCCGESAFVAAGEAVKVGVLVRVGVDVGSAVRVGVLDGTGVDVGRGVTVGVLVGTCVAVGSGVRVGEGVHVAVGATVWVGEGTGVEVLVAVEVAVGAAVEVAVFEGTAVATSPVGVMVGGSPCSVKVPEVFQPVPIKIWTSYWPGSQACASWPQVVMPIPAGELFQEDVSMYFRPPLLYQSAVHWILTPTG